MNFKIQFFEILLFLAILKHELSTLGQVITNKSIDFKELDEKNPFFIGFIIKKITELNFFMQKSYQNFIFFVKILIICLKSISAGGNFRSIF